MHKETIKKIATLIVRCTVSVAVMWCLFHNVNGRDVFDRIANSRLIFIVFLFINDFIGTSARVYRWHKLLTIWNIHIPVLKLYAFIFGGRFFNFVLPSSVGGDVFRMYLVNKDSHKRAGSALGIIIDRFCGMTMGFVLAMSALIWLPLHGISVPGSGIIWLIIAAWFGFLAVLFSRTLDRFVEKTISPDSKPARFFQSMVLVRKYPGVIIKSLAASLIVKLQEVLVTYFAAQALQLPVPLWFCLAFVPVISFATVMPVSLSGIGIRETMFILFFTQIGLTRTEAFSLSITVFSWMVIMGMISGILYFLWWITHSFRRAVAPTSENTFPDAT